MKTFIVKHPKTGKMKLVQYKTNKKAGELILYYLNQNYKVKEVTIQELP